MNAQSDCKQCGVCAYIVAVIGAFLIVAALVATMYHFTRPEALGEDRVAVRKKALAELRASNADVLDSQNYVYRTPASKGILHMPISQAMELSLKLWQDPAAARSNLNARVDKWTAVPPPQVLE